MIWAPISPSSLLILRGSLSHNPVPMAKKTDNGEEHQRHVNGHGEFEEDRPLGQS